MPAGDNVTNVTGAIDGLYPPTKPDAPPFTLPPLAGPMRHSVMFQAGHFSAAFDISTGAKPFTVVAAGEAAQTVIAFNPPNGSFEATVTVPNSMVRVGDFSASEFRTILDFAACLNGICTTFPNNMIPRGRLDPAMLRAADLLPMPDTPLVPGSAAASFRITGVARAGSRFVINNDTNTQLSRFGGFLQISQAGSKTRTTPFKLFVDGKLIASTDATYDVQQ